MQSSSSSRSFKPGLIGASPITDANLWLDANRPRSSVRKSAGVRSRRSQVRFLSWTPFSALVPQQLQGGFRKPVWWPPAKARCESDQGPHFNGDHDVTAASRPVKAFVPVRIRLVTPISKCFESASSRFGSLRERFCVFAGSKRD